MNTDSSFNTSDRLVALDDQIATAVERLQQIRTERGEALNEKAAGDDGAAAEKLTTLRTERAELEDDLSDIRAAREIEAERLQSAHGEALRDAQQQRREAVESARKECFKNAERIDKAVDKVLSEMAALELAGSSLAQVHQNGAGNALVREAIEVIKERIAEYDRSNPDAGKKVASRMPGSDLILSASIPDSLDKLNG